MNLTRESVLWWILLALSLVTALATVDTSTAVDLGIPAKALPYIRLIAFLTAAGSTWAKTSPFPSGKNVPAILLALGLAFSFGCSHNAAVVKLSPEGKAAFYGEAFMARVEQAQDQTIGLVGVANITRADVTPAVEVFVKIGKGGQALAADLKVIDESNVTADKQAAAVRVRAAVDAFQGLLANLNVQVSSEAARARIAQIVAAVKLGAALFDVIQRISPLLPESKAAAAFALRPPLQLALAQ